MPSAMAPCRHKCMMRPAHAASSSLFHLAILQHQISDKVFDLVSDPQKREEVMAELTKTLDPAEQEVRVKYA